MHYFRLPRWADKYKAAMSRSQQGQGVDDEDKLGSSTAASGAAGSGSSGVKANKAFMPFSDGIKNCLGQVRRTRLRDAQS